jgi:hypothetical protein
MESTGVAPPDSINAEAGRGLSRRRHQDDQTRHSSGNSRSGNSRSGGASRSKKGASTGLWGCVAFVFIVITVLLALSLGAMFYKQYMGQQTQAKLGSLFTDGGRAVSYLYAANDTAKLRRPVGYVRFFAEDDAVRVVAEMTGLEPGTSHGFHVFQYSDPLGTNYGEVMSIDKSSKHGCPDSSTQCRTVRSLYPTSTTYTAVQWCHSILLDSTFPGSALFTLASSALS